MDLGKVWSAGNSSDAIYRYNNASTFTHYYSLSSNVPSGFYFENIMGYTVYAGVPAMVNPVYQFHDDHGDFFYSIDSTIPQGYHLDGVAFQVTP